MGRVVRVLGPVLALCLLALAIGGLHHELAGLTLRDVLLRLQAIPRADIGLALALTGLDYWVLTGYDTLAFRVLRSPLRYARIALGSFVAYAVSHSVGAAFLGGSAVRYRIFSTAGVAARDIARVIAFNVGTFWLGFLATAGVVLGVWPLPVPALSWISPASSRSLGIAMLALCACASAVSIRRLRRANALPGGSIVLARLAVSGADWILAACVLYVLLPPAAGLAFPRFLGAHLLSVLLGLVSQVPAGLGVYETSMVLLLAPALPADTVLGSILAYRIVYEVLPLAVALGLLVAHELSEVGRTLRPAGAFLRRLAPALVPRLFALAALLAGAILLFSGATPPLPERMRWLIRLLPQPVLELSHMVGSAVGVALLFLARALLWRVDAAYFLALALLAAGAVASLLKGLDYEEATVLALLFAALLPFRSSFDRRSSLFAHAFSPTWALAVLGVLAAAAVLGQLAYQGVASSSEPWWRFALHGDASRSLRALAVASALLAMYALARLLSPAAPRARLPTSAELDKLHTIVAAAPRTAAHLVLVGDKPVLLHANGNAFLMYGVHGRSWISMGDPIGPGRERRELAWEFRELADRHGGRTAFYEVGTDDLPLYVELGLSLHKLGEEARVPLARFSLDGARRKSLRHSRNRLTRDGCRVEILPALAVGALLPALETISRDWLAHKHAHEKRFSLGYFDRAYLQRLPLAVLRRGEQILAFANLWTGAAREELSIDLMRQRADAPPGTMQYLFAELMLWGRSEGYRWFNLGMAPFSGLESRPLAPIWNRVGSVLFRHGELFYGFRGLREFKEKFDPVWEPRFLASPSTLTVPVILADAAALIGGSAALGA